MTVGGTAEIAVVVATYDRAHLLDRLVDALEAQTLAPDRFEVVLVDNGSLDPRCHELLEERRRRSALAVQVLRIEANRGPAPARNLGWRATTAAFVAFTDDDCVPHPDWLERLLDRAVATPDLGVLQGATLRPPGDYQHSMTTSYRETLAPSPYFEGSNLCFPRDVLERTGGFDERYVFGAEDTSAGWSAQDGGRTWVFEPRAAVVHDISERPWRWHLMMAWREGLLVDIAKRYPAFRQQALWRPWAHRPRNAAMAVAVAGTVVSPWLPAALAAWLPWAWLRRPPWRAGFRGVVAFAHWWTNDIAVLGGMVRGSIRNRTVVL